MSHSSLPAARTGMLLMWATTLLGACGRNESGVVQSHRDAGVLEAGTDGGAAEPCDFHAQDCPSDEKCNVVLRSDRYESLCVARGEQPLGEACERSAIGVDDCAPGLFCTPVAVQNDGRPPMRCRTLCDSNAQCDGGERCYRFSTGQADVFGLCVPPCVFFDTECGEGLHCSLVVDAARALFGICSEHGSVAEGGTCASPYDCASGMACATPENRCREFCDPTHPCEGAERTCEPLQIAGFPGLGVCIP